MHPGSPSRTSSPATVNFVTTYVSYAYPAGAAIKAINDVEILPQ
ncbi:hypothetical protein [Nannocystis bainbridge]|uniref:Uncharacterized protein n=1 Tax=Nannocystis bainbridge TaxID=2995303 RepID=A0ABT5DXM5_9BACT|nr:hypothetical protein [Nannocystis bainbridge]MDC0717197.1 hypothetical protein [Nannocystis bainbridge]